MLPIMIMRACKNYKKNFHLLMEERILRYSTIRMSSDKITK